jgi:hypothetical protein
MIVPELRKPMLVCGVYGVLIVLYLLFCAYAAEPYRIYWDDGQRTLLRSVLYIAAIVLFPLTNLARFILLRLNQTMPGPRSVAQRYFTTVLVAQSVLHSVAVCGPLMFLLGDGWNTLWIFSILGVLAIFLHRPKREEYQAIEYALAHLAAA